jgi:nucleotide-binding universal stress UspA family protein
MSKLSAHPGIVVGVDGSPGSRAAVKWAARDAELRKVPLTLVHVLPVTGARGPRRHGQRLLDEALELVDECCERGPAEIFCEMLRARTVPALVELSKDADLIVVGCFGTGTLRGRHLGSITAGLVHHAECPVAIIHDDVRFDGTAARAPVLVGIDGSPESDLAIAVAFDEASRREVGLVAVHAWPDVGVFDSIVSAPGPGWQALRAAEDKMVGEHLAGWRERYPDVTVETVIARDNAAHQLVAVSESAQLVVVGNHGGGGFAGVVLGSVSASLMMLAHVPVITVRKTPMSVR